MEKYIKTKVTPVILCGGSGSRLWPLSRAGFPKQFLCLKGDKSLFQQALIRMANLDNDDLSIANNIVVTGEDHRFLVQEQLRETELSSSTIILEPEGRNTAPALTLAAMHALENGEDSILLVTPADQTISDQYAFNMAMKQAINIAKADSIAILGIKPDRPETGFGYVKAINSKEYGVPVKVEKFIEKPDIKTAQNYIEDGAYQWNAGIFVLKASIWLKALKEFRSDIYDLTLNTWQNKKINTNFISLEKKQFSKVPSESIDYAVMEHCNYSTYSLYLVGLNAGWSDLGTWDSVWKSLSKDECGNASIGDVILNDSYDSLVKSTSRLVSLVGVRDLVVIETPDAVMVSNKKSSQNIKSIVSSLQKSGRVEYEQHRKVNRPWGWYDNIDEDGNFKVKKILVNPGASLSLQKHNFRSEHWIVVKGIAEITNGKKVLMLKENESTYIPLGEKHRLSNPGLLPLEIIEIQLGSYLGEDDIIRYEDNYGRTSN
jgi:mannose-1-phosphate guanylyltransferase/mannose-6-phosphate isomerase